MNRFVLLCGGLLFLTTSCTKLLDEKSDKSLVIPSTLKDLQALLDNYNYLGFNDPGAGEVSSTDYYLTDEDYQSMSADEDKRMYTWQPDHLFAPSSNQWMFGYRAIYYANSALSSLEDIPLTGSNSFDFNNVKGQAYFYRAKFLFNMAVVWVLAYDRNTTSDILGLPLRTGTDFNEPSVRSNQKETFELIISDLKQAIPCLPETPIHVMRPSKPAAYAQLAKVYLYMQDYQNAGLYADSCLQLQHELINYNDVDTSRAYSFDNFNEEVIMHSVIGTPAPLNISRAKISPDLYALYADGDLRKQVFFKLNSDGSHAFKGSYSGTMAPFGGLSVNEILLIRIEALTRANELDEAAGLLKTLYEKRWDGNSAIPSFEGMDQRQLLSFVLEERRRELPMRGVRWYDIKRLNKEGANIHLSRMVEGQEYSLPANDPRTALPLPEDVIALSGMQQNPR